MNREDIVRMAQEAHFNSKTWIDIYKDEITAGDVKGYLEAFAALVASAEREACAKVCDSRVTAYQYATDVWAQEHIDEARHLAKAIRARGQA